MKKISAYILAIFSIVLMACQKEPQELQQPEQDGKVTLQLKFAAPEASVVTKALGETVDLAANGLWVVVYESGYRCEVVQAEDLAVVSSTTTEDIYSCSLTLSVTENERNLHFLSMAGFSAEDAPYEETRFGSLITEDNSSGVGLDAYWQIRTVSCIPYNNPVDKWNDFVDELVGSTGKITLIRNFVKVTMSNTATDFSLTSFKVFNTPDKGYVAPYISSGSNNGFVKGYDALAYFGTTSPAVSGAVDVYPGRMPNDCHLKGYTSDDDDCSTFYDYSSDPDLNEAQYFYERPEPKEDPAFIIVQGKYGSDTYDTYYKVNLRDAEGKYYALLRGFRFKVNVEKVTARGYATVQEAVNSGGSGDISTSLEFANIGNISDGICRLFVSTTSITAVKKDTVEIKYMFIPDYANAPDAQENGVVDVDIDTNIGVEITVNDPDEGLMESIASYSVGTADVAGWRTITVITNNPESLYKEQTITIRGRGKNTSTGVSSVIQREIHVIVRPTLALYVEMASGYETIAKTKGTNVWVNLYIEDELPESIFPLNIKIEATKLTLSPAAGEQLPVESGQSASTTTTKPTFYFVKTIDYSSYASATASDVTISPGNTRKMRKFVSKFVTNTAESASDIYVSNDLFTTSHTSFTNP